MNDRYESCVLVAQGERKKKKKGTPLKDTTYNWGNKPPILLHLVQHYQRQFSIDPKHLLKEPTEPTVEDPVPHGPPVGWTKEVQQCPEGGHYYIDHHEDTVYCDEQGIAWG